MDLFFDFIVEALFEIFCEAFISLGEALVPDHVLSEKARTIIALVVFFLSLALFLGLVVGIFLLVESAGQNSWGWVLVALSGAYVVLGIGLRLRVKKKHGAERM